MNNKKVISAVLLVSEASRARLFSEFIGIKQRRIDTVIGRVE